MRTLLQRDPPPSIILFGPPGCGKTTIASIIAHHTSCPFRTLSCCTAGVQDIRDVAAQAAKDRQSKGVPTVLFMDEIHRFNKKQQDIFLPYVEQGLLVLIGATTENPSFALNDVVSSRPSHAGASLALPSGSAEASLRRRPACHPPPRARQRRVSPAQWRRLRCLSSPQVSFRDASLRLLATKADGDARMALNMLDACAATVASRADKWRFFPVVS